MRLALMLTLVVAGLVIGCSSEPSAPITTPVPVVPQIFPVGANLANANLREADLSGADFRGADLSGADLTDSTRDTANFEGVDMTTCIVEKEEGFFGRLFHRKKKKPQEDDD